MKIFNIVRCGTFDSKKNFKNLKESEKRKIDYFEIEYVISSNGTAYIGNTNHKLSSGMILIRKPNEICYTKLHFKNYFLSLKIEPTNDYYGFLLNCPTYFTNVNSKEYLEIFQSLVNNTALLGKDSDSELITIDILKLLYLLKKDAVYNSSNYKDVKLTPTVSKIIKYLDNNFQNKIQLDDLSDKFGYSSFYILKRFKEITGVSPNQYILDKRIDMAKQEIINTNCNMTEIAYKCGFSSQSYFCYSFKEKTGISPSEYKKSVNNNYKL